MEDTILTTSDPEGPRRVQAVVALRLLEVMRDQDLPGEILEEEDPTQTIPRRFGLSNVVERQIRTYKDDVRRRIRLTDGEIHGLFRLVIRRPDGSDVFHQAGKLLANGRRPKRWVRVFPKGLQYRVARATAMKKLRKLFGRQVGGFGRAPFLIEGRALLFIESDPGGDACHLISGFSEEILEHTLGGTAEVSHTCCQGQGDDLCRWEGKVVESAVTVADMPGRDEDDS